MKNQLHKMGPPSALLGLKKHVRRNLEFWYSLINLTFPFEDIAKKKKEKKKMNACLILHFTRGFLWNINNNKNRLKKKIFRHLEKKV